MHDMAWGHQHKLVDRSARRFLAEAVGDFRRELLLIDTMWFLPQPCG
jgi:hypothetical protein